jgi:hypothetical protein
MLKSGEFRNFDLSTMISSRSEKTATPTPNIPMLLAAKSEYGKLQ